MNPAELQIGEQYLLYFEGQYVDATYVGCITLYKFDFNGRIVKLYIDDLPAERRVRLSRNGQLCLDNCELAREYIDQIREYCKFDFESAVLAIGLDPEHHGVIKRALIKETIFLGCEINYVFHIEAEETIEYIPENAVAKRVKETRYNNLEVRELPPAASSLILVSPPPKIRNFITGFRFNYQQFLSNRHKISELKAYMRDISVLYTTPSSQVTDTTYMYRKMTPSALYSPTEIIKGKTLIQEFVLPFSVIDNLEFVINWSGASTCCHYIIKLEAGTPMHTISRDGHIEGLMLPGLLTIRQVFKSLVQDQYRVFFLCDYRAYTHAEAISALEVEVDASEL